MIQFVDYIAMLTPSSFEKLNKFIDCYKDHGRIETRDCRVVTGIEWLRKLHPHWSMIKSIIEIKSTREIKDKVTTETRYYISSMDTNY